MEKLNRSSKQSIKQINPIITIIVLIVLCVSLSFSFIFLRNKTKLFYTLTNDLNTSIYDLNLEINNQEELIKELNLEIEKNKDVDSLIVEMKNQYPSLAKELEEAIDNNEIDAKIAYLTFDDGPYKKTNYFLDVLDEYDVRATFFTLEKSAATGWTDEDLEAVDNVYKRIINEGHTLGNHTSNHKIKNGIYLSKEAFMKQIKKHTAFTLEKYNYNSRIIRFPGGSSQAHSLKSAIVEELVKEGYGYVDWNSQTGDGSSKTACGVEQSIANVVDTTNNRKFLVVLMHDYSETSLQALPSIIEGLRDKGYTLLPLFYESKMVNKN